MIRKISISPSLAILLVICFISDAYVNFFALLIAAGLHELGHLIIARILNIRIESLELSIFGALIKTSNLSCSYKKEALLAFAGPVCNIVCAVISILLLSHFQSEFLSVFFAASSGLAMVNLLPIKNFDGGRILSSVILRRLSPRAAHCIVEFSSFLFLFLIWSVSVYFIIRSQKYLPLFVFSGATFLRMFINEG